MKNEAKKQTDSAKTQLNLQEQCLALETKCKDYEEKISELELLVKHYEERLRLNAQKKFGQSSEQTSNYEQLGFFDEAEATADKKLSELTIEEITYKRKKRVGKREEAFSTLPIATIVHELPENERACPVCTDPLHVMGKETRKELTIIPAKVCVTEHIRSVYSCRTCERETDTVVPVVKAMMPQPVIKGSHASPSAVAHIMASKYVMHLPLYRQEQELDRMGISLSRQTMSNWMVKTSELWLEPLYRLCQAELIKCSVLHADETRLQVLNEPNRKANTESYMWLYRTGADTDKPIVLYDYQETRSSSHPKRFLTGYKGYLQTDGYKAYKTLCEELSTGMVSVGCWAHMRRKFDEALKGLSEKEQADSLALKGLEFCNSLFNLERNFDDELGKDLTLTPLNDFKRRKELRDAQSVRMAESFFGWIKSLNVLPKSLLGKAVTYAREQQKYLMNVFLDGRLELSNNRAERSIKPFVIGRKNWLFSNTNYGATASSVIYSIIETAKENGLIPFEYLKWLFEQLPNATTSQLYSFLPWSELIPPHCRLPAKHATKNTAPN